MASDLKSHGTGCQKFQQSHDNCGREFGSDLQHFYNWRHTSEAVNVIASREITEVRARRPSAAL